MNKLSIKDIELEGKKVFIRVDFNVPIQGGKVADDTRIIGALPTIKFVLENNGKVILASHLGRPTEAREEKFSLKPVSVRLSEVLGKDVQFCN